MATNTTDHDLKDELASLRRDLQAVREDLGRVTSSAIERGRQTASQLREEAGDRVDASMNSARTAVRDNPLAAAAIAAGVGVVVGALLSRR